MCNYQHPGVHAPRAFSYWPPSSPHRYGGPMNNKPIFSIRNQASSDALVASTCNVPCLVADNVLLYSCRTFIQTTSILLLRWRGQCRAADATPSCTLLSSDGRWVLDLDTSSRRTFDEPTINNQTGMPSAWCTDGKEYVLIDTVLGTRSQLFGRWTPIQQSSHPPTLTDVHNKE